MTTPNHYAELGVTREDPPAVIRDAYHKRMMDFHPDRGGTSDASVPVIQAYAILSVRCRREAYDDLLKLCCPPCPDCNSLGVEEVVSPTTWNVTTKPCPRCCGAGFLTKE